MFGDACVCPLAVGHLPRPTRHGLSPPSSAGAKVHWAGRFWQRAKRSVLTGSAAPAVAVAVDTAAPRLSRGCYSCLSTAARRAAPPGREVADARSTSRPGAAPLTTTPCKPAAPSCAAGFATKLPSPAPRQRHSLCGLQPWLLCERKRSLPAGAAGRVVVILKCREEGLGVGRRNHLCCTCHDHLSLLPSMIPSCSPLLGTHRLLQCSTRLPGCVECNKGGTECTLCCAGHRLAAKGCTPCADASCLFCRADTRRCEECAEGFYATAAGECRLVSIRAAGGGRSPRFPRR